LNSKHEIATETGRIQLTSHQGGHKSSINNRPSSILGKKLSTIKIALEKIFTLKLMTLIPNMGLEYMPSCWVKNQSIFFNISQNIKNSSSLIKIFQKF
jgi:hypothetical protein